MCALLVCLLAFSSHHQEKSEALGRRIVGEIFVTPLCSNLKGFAEPEIRHLARRVGGVSKSSFSDDLAPLFSVDLVSPPCWTLAEHAPPTAPPTAPAGNGAPLRPNSPVANAATDPAVHEQQDSSLPLSVWLEGRTATPSPSPATASSSLVCRGPVYQQPALLMARDLLRYRPADDLYDEWLHCITELVNAAGEAPTPTHSSRPPSPMAGN